MKIRILCVTALLALGIAKARAEEMATPPSTWITAQTPYLAWSGPYAGLNGGYGWGNSTPAYHANDPVAATACGAVCIPSVDFHRDGGLAGGQVGFNWQFDTHWLAGVEADYQWSDFTGSRTSSFRLTAPSTPSTMTSTQTIESFGTIRVRAGVLVTNSLLLYGTGGFAVAEAREKANLISSGAPAGASAAFSFNCIPGTVCFAGSSSKTLVGWVAGAGAEVAVTTGLTFKTELLFMDLESSNTVATATAPTAGTSPSSYTANYSSAAEILFRGGFNVRF